MEEAGLPGSKCLSDLASPTCSLRLDVRDDNSGRDTQHPLLIRGGGTICGFLFPRMYVTTLEQSYYS